MWQIPWECARVRASLVFCYAMSCVWTPNRILPKSSTQAEACNGMRVPLPVCRLSLPRSPTMASSTSASRSRPRAAARCSCPTAASRSRCRRRRPRSSWALRSGGATARSCEAQPQPHRSVLAFPPKSCDGTKQKANSRQNKRRTRTSRVRFSFWAHGHPCPGCALA